jgi:hypothetical protein
MFHHPENACKCKPEQAAHDTDCPFWGMTDYTASAGDWTKDDEKKAPFTEKLGFAVFLTIVIIPIASAIVKFWADFGAKIVDLISSK